LGSSEQSLPGKEWSWYGAAGAILPAAEVSKATQWAKEVAEEQQQEEQEADLDQGLAGEVGLRLGPHRR
jgi:hypothetical protein